MFFLLFSLFLQLITPYSWGQAPQGKDALFQAPEFNLTRADLVSYDHFLQIYRVASKGYASDYILDKGIKESAKNPRLAIFHEWLVDLKRYPTLPTEQLLQTCIEAKARLKITSGVPRRLLLQSLTRCRQVAIQQMAPRILSSGGFMPQDIAFLRKFMQPFLFGRNTSDFYWLIQRFQQVETSRKIISDLVIEHIIKSKRQVPREMLPLLTITPDLTQHIQTFGLDSRVTLQVFYDEFSRMIETSYKIIDSPNKELAPVKAEELKNWLSLHFDKLPAEATLERYYNLGKNLWRNGFEVPAAQIFDFVAKQASPAQRDDAWFFRLWMWASKGDWENANKWIKDNKLLSKLNEITDSRLKYWLAQVQHKAGNSKEAFNIWEKTLEAHPLSFYGIMSVKAIQNFNPDSSYAKYYQTLDAGNIQVLIPADVDSTLWASWNRLRAWARLDAKGFLNAEIRGLQRQIIPNIISKMANDKKATAESEAWLITAALLGQENNFIESFRVLYTQLDNKKVKFNRMLLETLYPKPYFDDLKVVTKGHEIDPLVLLSLIRQESVFNPGARSRVGARGLMQLMPTTARRMKNSVRENHLSTPKTNMEIGVKYFKQLMKRYEGNLVYVLAAYNAGESRVDRWKGQYFVGDEILPNVEAIPFLETRNYVKLIFRNLFFYKTLEGQKDLLDPTPYNQIYDVALGFKR